jgi:hypothetical protein
MRLFREGREYAVNGQRHKYVGQNMFKNFKTHEIIVRTPTMIIEEWPGIRRRTMRRSKGRTMSSRRATRGSRTRSSSNSIQMLRLDSPMYF